MKQPLKPEPFPFTKSFQAKHRLLQLKEWTKFFSVGLVPSHVAQFLLSIGRHTKDSMQKSPSHKRLLKQNPIHLQSLRIFKQQNWNKSQNIRTATPFKKEYKMLKLNQLLIPWRHHTETELLKWYWEHCLDASLSFVVKIKSYRKKKKIWQFWGTISQA